jgi:nicotinic acid mononucleotide adenylyltransferase
VLLNTLAEAYGLEARLTLSLGEGDDHQCQRVKLADPARKVLAGQLDYFSLAADGWLDGAPDGAAILSGAFNPLHYGHTALAEAAADMLGVDVLFELTAVNADKPPLPEGDLLRRLLQFAGRYPVLVSSAPTFQAKSRLFPGTTFVVGFDTAARILQARFYGGQEAQMVAALTEIREQGCNFLVAGREGQHGQFHEADELVIPRALQDLDLFQTLPGHRFRRDISSTEIRNRRRR